jgi:hypothetical protein
MRPLFPPHFDIGTDSADASAALLPREPFR